MRALRRSYECFREVTGLLRAACDDFGHARSLHWSSPAAQAVTEDREQPGNTAFDATEVGKFSAMAAEWWDPRGPMAPLHSMNPTRVQFLRRALCKHFERNAFEVRPLTGLSVADIGAGAGILSESLARMGAAVTGVDASSDAIRAAEVHRKADTSLQDRIRYRRGTAEQLLAEEAPTFDVVIASEIIEHMPDPEGFCEALTGLTRQRGCIVISTLNRTPRSYALAIVGAENVLGAIPPGTHDWSNFIAPDELVMLMRYVGMRLIDISGMTFSLLRQRWSLSDDLGVNYIAAFSTSGPERA